MPNLMQMLRLQNIFGNPAAMVGNDLPDQGGIGGNLTMPPIGPPDANPFGNIDLTGGGIPPSPLGGPDASAPSDASPLGMPKPDTGYDAGARMAALYHPEHGMSDRLSHMIETYPTRPEPSGLRKLSGALLGSLSAIGGLTNGPGNWGGTPDNRAGTFTFDELTGKNAFNEKVSDWQNKVKPIEEAAQIERSQNNVDRQNAYQTIAAELRQHAQEAKDRNDQVNAQIRQHRADVYDFKSKNPGMKVITPKGGNIQFYNPADGTTKDSGIPAGSLSELDKLNLQAENNIEAIKQKTKGQLQVEGAKDEGLNKRAEERMWGEPVNIADPNNPGQQIAVQVRKDTGEVRPVKIGGQGTSLTGKGGAGGPGSKADQITTQTKAMMEGSRMLLPHIPELRSMAQNLDKAGLFGPVMSRIRDLAAKVGTTGSPDEVANHLEDFANAITSDPQLNNDVLTGQFTTMLGLMASGAGRVHGGARGGGSIQMVNYLKNLLSAEGTLNMFNGRLNSLESVLKGYAKGPIAPTNDKLDSALEKIFGSK